MGRVQGSLQGSGQGRKIASYRGGMDFCEGRNPGRFPGSFSGRKMAKMADFAGPRSDGLGGFGENWTKNDQLVPLGGKLFGKNRGKISGKQKTIIPGGEPLLTGNKFGKNSGKMSGKLGEPGCGKLFGKVSG